MGSALSSAMDENMKKTQEFMGESQKAMLSRQIEMQFTMRERQMAMQIASARDVFSFYSVFFGLACSGMLAGFLKSKKPTMLVPLIPLGTVFAYQYDFAYGNKITRLRAEAENILALEPHRLAMPAGPLSVGVIDASIAGTSPGADAAAAAERFAATQAGTQRAAWQTATGEPVGAQLSGPARAAFYAQLAAESAEHLRRLP